MVHISSKVGEVYEDVRNDKTETNWLILGYEDDKGESLGVCCKGMKLIT
jgi:hypothetical protein